MAFAHQRVQNSRNDTGELYRRLDSSQANAFGILAGPRVVLLVFGAAVDNVAFGIDARRIRKTALQHSGHFFTGVVMARHFTTGLDFDEFNTRAIHISAELGRLNRGRQSLPLELIKPCVDHASQTIRTVLGQS